MTPQEFVDRIRAEGAVRYKGRSRPGQSGDFVDDPSWPYINARQFVQMIDSGVYTYEQERDALWTQLDLFGGDAYGAFIMCEHDSGHCVLDYLRFGESSLVRPAPPDTRLAPQDNALQVSFIEQGLNPFGQVMDAFHAKEGAAKWANFSSLQPVNAYGVFPDTARWLCVMDLIEGDLRVKSTWDAYRGLDIVGCIQVLKLGYPA